MKLWQIVVVAVVGSIVVSVGSIVLPDINQYPSKSVSIATIKILAQKDLADLAAVFVMAFAVLSVAMSILAFRIDLRRLVKFYGRLSRFSSEIPANLVGSLPMEEAARKIGDTILEDGITGEPKHLITLDMQRAMRLETQRAYVQRLLLLQASTLVLGVVYQFLFTNVSESSKDILPQFLHWSVFVPAIIVLTGGTLLWMDELAEWVITEIVTNFRYAREKDHRPVANDSVSPGEIEPILMKHLERIEIANEGLYQRVAEFLVSSRLFREKSMDSAKDIDDLEKSIRELLGGIRPVAERISSEQEGIQAAIRKQTLELASISKRQGDTATKLEVIDSTLNRLARVIPNSPQQGQVRADPKSKIQSTAVVRTLENLLSDLADKNKPT